MNELIDTIVSAIQDKKGKRILSLDLSGFDGAICSAFVVCSADSTTQVEAIAGGVEQKVLEKLGEKVWRGDGLRRRDGACLPDRDARLLQARAALGRRSRPRIRGGAVEFILRPRSVAL